MTLLLACACQSTASVQVQATIAPDPVATGPQIAAQGPAARDASPMIAGNAASSANWSGNSPDLASAPAQQYAHTRSAEPKSGSGALEAACSQRCVTMYADCSWRAQVACIDRCVMTGASSSMTARWRGSQDMHGAPVAWANPDAHAFDVELGERGQCTPLSAW